MPSDTAVKAEGIRHLRFDDFAPGRPYHAALIAVEGYRARGFQVTEHTHDFYEIMLVLAGEALHQVNGRIAPILSGDLILLRPGDRHSVRFQSGRLLHYMNIAVSAGFWNTFQEASGAGPILEEAGGLSAPLSVSLSEGQALECAIACRRSLESFERERSQLLPVLPVPTARLEACRLLSSIVPLLLPASREPESENWLPEVAPIWLVDACRKLRTDPETLRAGLPAFAAAARVTPTHLARVLKAFSGQTPTGYINGLRLARAARLLTTTTLSPLEIAAECGFEQPSYFYRLFRAQFDSTPQAYRNAAARGIAPMKKI